MKTYHFKKTVGMAVAAAIASAIASAARSEDVPLGYSSTTLVAPIFVLLQERVVAAAKEAGFKVLSPTNADMDASKQLADIQNLIGAGAKGLIVSPLDGKAINPALTYASRQNVPTVVIDAAPEGAKFAAVVRADNVAMGRIACEAMGAAIGYKGKVLSLQGSQTNLNARERAHGFRECVQKHAEMELFERDTDWDAAKAASILQTVLGANPDLKGVFEMTDSALPGTLNVLKRAGRDAKVGEPDHIYHIAIDGGPVSLASIRNGRLDASISQPIDGYAKYGVQYLKDALAGKELALGKTDHGSEIVEYYGGKMDLLPAVLVTKQNVDDPALWGNQAK